MAHSKHTKKQVIEMLKKTPIVQIACEKLGVGRASYYRWKQEDKTFSREVDIAIEDGIKLINDMAESQLLSSIKDKNLRAITFWLKNHHKKYANKVELSGTINHNSEELNSEQEKLVKKALTNAGLLKRRKDGGE